MPSGNGRITGGGGGYHSSGGQFPLPAALEEPDYGCQMLHLDAGRQLLFAAHMVRRSLGCNRAG